jgi:hypothetical protein
MLLFQVPLAASGMLMVISLNVDVVGLILYCLYLLAMCIFWVNRRLSSYRGTDLVPLVFSMIVLAY